MDKKLSGIKKICLVIFIIYIIVVLKLTIFREITYADRQLNLTVFTGLIKLYKNAEIWQFLRLFLGNLGWFIPFGFFLTIFINIKSILKIALYTFGFSLAIEIMQFIFKKGVAEIDDLVLNTIGGILGYFIYKKFYLGLLNYKC